tara:strand:+ start:9198 stop:10787 length:1590 start_codon:yes stop_codon:yes gene_type:complete
MSKVKGQDRIAFLAEKFNVFTIAEIETDLNQDNGYVYLKDDETDVTIRHVGVDSLVGVKPNSVLAAYKYKIVEDGGALVSENVNRAIKKFKDLDVTPLFGELSWLGVSEKVFLDIVAADPTKKKVYVQWMLTMFTRLIKESEFSEAIRFVTEDLLMAKDYLDLFHKNKTKKIFKEICKKGEEERREQEIIGLGLRPKPVLNDFSDINQYKTLSELFQSIEPFIERDLSALEREIKVYVKSGQAEVPYKDDKFTLYIPNTIKSSTIFSDFVSWCTAKRGNSNFDGYTRQETPYGTKSKLFIIIDNRMFLPTNDPNYKDSIWQFHFESGQTMDKNNRTENDIYGNILSKSRGMKDYFYKVLLDYAKKSVKNGKLVKENKYVKYLIKFGFSDVLFEIMDENCMSINLLNESIETLPDMSKFKNLNSLILQDVKLESIHESVGNLTNLGVLSIPKNKITSIPKSICNLKKLSCINLVGNKLTEVPDEIANLDKSNGGKLVRFTVSKGDVKPDVIAKLRRLLPEAKIVEFVADS